MSRMTSPNGTPRDRNAAYCPVRDLVLPQACLHAPSFHALLATRSTWQAKRLQPEESGNISIYRKSMYTHQARCLQIVNEDLRGQADKISQGSVQAIAFQVVQQVSRLKSCRLPAADYLMPLKLEQCLRGDYTNGRVHLIGLHSVVQARGGLASLNPELQIFVVWYAELSQEHSYLLQSS